MKRQMRFIARQAASLDPQAVKIFAVTRLAVCLTLLVSLFLLGGTYAFSWPADARLLADGLFHASFRMAAVGAATGFGADIMAKRGGK